MNKKLKTEEWIFGCFELPKVYVPALNEEIIENKKHSSLLQT